MSSMAMQILMSSPIGEDGKQTKVQNYGGQFPPKLCNFFFGEWDLWMVGDLPSEKQLLQLLHSIFNFP